MTRDAAVVAVVLSLAAAWYGAKWFQAEDDETGAKAKAEAASKAAWKARKVMAAVVAAGIVAVNAWFHGKGR